MDRYSVLSQPEKQNNPLVLRANLKWDIYLDAKQERKPFLHFYLSTNYSPQVHEVYLDDAASGSMKLVLKFDPTEKLNTATAKELLQGCDLNVDTYVHTVNQYKEPITNPAGSSIIPLHEIVTLLGPHTSGGSLTSPVILFMVHDDKKRVKGQLTLESITLSQTTGQVAPVVSLRGVALTERDVKNAAIQAIIERNEKMQHICGRYIESTEVIYEGVDPTIESVSNINSAIWVSRAGIFPPIAYTLDVVRPKISEAFYLNCLDIVLRRLDMHFASVLKLDLINSQKDIKLMGSLAGQLLCCYISHCTYRTDFVIAYNRDTKKFEYVPTENFGDVSVDRGAGDCEDFGKMIIRIYLGLVRFHKNTQSEVLQKIISFLKCYYPFLVLLGVSSAQINAAPKDIVNMGAHENAMLVPLQQFMDEVIRFNPRARAWKDQIINDPEQREFWERSRNYPDLVLEGTGILEPVMAKEESIKTRLVLEEFMEEDVFYALRRSYYYDQKHTSFYKTVEKIFTPVPIIEGGSFGSFLIMQKHSGTGALRKRLTKSVGFSEFLADGKDVSVFMEPELTEAEKLSIFEGMKNIHPPVPLAPPSPGSPKKQRCEKEMDLFKSRIKPLVKPPLEAGLKAASQVYYLRSGKVDRETMNHIYEWLTSLPPGMLLKVDIHDEWVTDDVGGYRLVVWTEKSVIDSHWKKNEKVLAKKLPKD